MKKTQTLITKNWSNKAWKKNGTVACGSPIPCFSFANKILTLNSSSADFFNNLKFVPIMLFYILILQTDLVLKPISTFKKIYSI